MSGYAAPVRGVRIHTLDLYGSGIGWAGNGHGWDSRAKASDALIRTLDLDIGYHRCPAYVDLYARNPKKLQGNWTVFVVVKDGDDDGGVSDGKLWLRSTKNLSIIPAELIVSLLFLLGGRWLSSCRPGGVAWVRRLAMGCRS